MKLYLHFPNTPSWRGAHLKYRVVRRLFSVVGTEPTSVFKCNERGQNSPLTCAIDSENIKAFVSI
jgi:hypothetical protein